MFNRFHRIYRDQLFPPLNRIINRQNSFRTAVDENVQPLGKKRATAGTFD